MKQRTSFEVAYDALSRLSSGPTDDAAVSEVRKALGGRTSLLVSKAADIAANLDLHELIPDMVSAFDRFMVDGSKSDKQCNAKISIVNALNKLEYMGDSVFLAGAHYIQMEPVYGGQVDTAVRIRCACANALARMEHPEAVYILTDLLVDTEHVVRTAAAAALSYLAHPESEVLLRLKVLAGDEEPDVVRECFQGLMTMAPERSLGFVARFLQSDSAAVSQYAALAIGSSRMPAAYDTLRECWDDFPSPATRRMLLLPIALVRSNEAFDFLLEVLRKSDPKTAIEAVSALRIYPSEDCVRNIRAAVAGRRDAELTKVFQSEFGS